MATFYHNSVVAVLAMLSKINPMLKQSRITGKQLSLSQINAKDLKFTDVEPKVSCTNKLCINRSDYKADVFLAAF